MCCQWNWHTASKCIYHTNALGLWPISDFCLVLVKRTTNLAIIRKSTLQMSTMKRVRKVPKVRKCFQGKRIWWRISFTFVTHTKKKKRKPKMYRLTAENGWAIQTNQWIARAQRKWLTGWNFSHISTILSLLFFFLSSVFQDLDVWQKIERLFLNARQNIFTREHKSRLSMEHEHWSD